MNTRKDIILIVIILTIFALVSSNISGCLADSERSVSVKPFKKDVIANVTFWYYCSFVTNCTLAIYPYTNKTDYFPMISSNGWFYIDMIVTNALKYMYKADAAYLYDPFAKRVEKDGTILRVYSTNSTSNIINKLFVSKNFEYYSKYGYDKTIDMEKNYIKITNYLKNLRPNQKMPKIRYYTPDFDSKTRIFSLSASSEIIDQLDCASSHELIHVLVHLNNYMFNEGLAQCFQKEGNLNYKNQNVNLVSKTFFENINRKNLTNIYSIIDLVSDTNAFFTQMKKHDNAYQLVASFVYYNWFVIKNDTNFARFLLSMDTNYNKTMITNLYKKYTGKDFIKTVDAWTNWLSSINTNSDIYIKWN